MILLELTHELAEDPLLRVLASGLCLLVPNAVAETNKAAKQAEIRQNSERILAALYKAHPSARARFRGRPATRCSAMSG